MKSKFIILLIALLVILTGCGSSAAEETQVPASTNTVSEPEVVQETAEPVSNEPTLTMGQKNALGKAYDYLDYAPFSYSGLIQQLEYEGYSNADAVYAADNCGANWNEQAAKKGTRLS